MGMKRANSMKNTPQVVSAKARSRKIVKSGQTELPGEGGSLDRTRRMATMQRMAKRKPRILVLHAQPTCGIRLCSISGKTMPPTEPPAAAIPVAKPLRRRKKCPMALTEGVNIKLVPLPARRPMTIMKCQYSAKSQYCVFGSWVSNHLRVHSPISRVAVTSRTEPAMMSQNGPCLSNTGPI